MVFRVGRAGSVFPACFTHVATLSTVFFHRLSMGRDINHPARNLKTN